MKKRIIIFGKPQTGKSRLAKQMALAFENPVFLDGRDFLKSTFYFDDVDRDTDLIVVDDLLPKKFGGSIFVLAENIQIHKKLKESFIIPRPKTIITLECDEEFIDELDASIKRRCIFIKCEADFLTEMPTLEATRYYTATEILND